MNKNFKKPPRFSGWLISRMTAFQQEYSAAGDIEEVFYRIYTKSGYFKAALWYRYQCLVSMFRYLIFRINWSFVMFRNYLKISLRNIKRYKLYSFISITSLAVGMACAVLVMFYIQYELSFDRYHKNYERIYRVIRGKYTGMPKQFADILQSAGLQEIENIVRIDKITKKDRKLFSYGKKRFFEDKFFLADNSIFEIFSFPFLSGNPETALTDPNSIVLTESTAKKYFGKEDPIGKVINYQNNLDFIVTGVIRDIPRNSHFTFDLIASLQKVNIIRDFNYDIYWGANPFRTYLLLSEGVVIQDFQKKIYQLFSDRYFQHFNRKFKGNEFILQPLADVYLNPTAFGEIGKSGSIDNLYLYSAVALIILIAACINFTNLAASCAVKRMKEVGVRKVFGARKNQLIYQFVGESVIISFVSLIFGLLLCKLAAPFFAGITGIPMEIKYIHNFNFIIYLALLTVFTGVISGSYPGFFASSFLPAGLLKKRISGTFRGFSFRNVFVIIQFTVSAFAVCSIMIISGQMHFMKNKNLGFNGENIITIRFNEEDTNTKNTLKFELMKLSGVKYVTGLYSLFSESNVNTSVHWEGLDNSDEKMMRWIAVDFDFVKALEMELIEGRDFSKEFPSDAKRSYILTESAVNYIGWTNPVGKEFNVKEYGDIGPGRVIGVVKDFHFKSLHHRIEPFYLFLCPEYCNIVAVKMSPDNTKNTLLGIKKIWEDVLPGTPFEYSFFDEDFQRMYSDELSMNKMYKYFTFLTIFLAFIGLFGLTSFLVENRSKEIGIRKILGSSVFEILLLFNRDFFKNLFIANAIAIPAIYYVMSKWLENFAYKININPVFFILTLVSTFIFAFLIISSRAITAASVNPIKSIRHE